MANFDQTIGNSVSEWWDKKPAYRCRFALSRGFSEPDIYTLVALDWAEVPASWRHKLLTV